MGKSIAQKEQKKMLATIKAKADAKIAAIDQKIKQLKCKSMKDCKLSTDQQAIVEGRVATLLEKVMQQYDQEHGTRKLDSKQVAAAQAKTEKKVAKLVEKEKMAAIVASEAKPEGLEAGKTADKTTTSGTKADMEKKAKQKAAAKKA